MRIIRVLIVEDDPSVAEVNRGFVERIEGFGVVGMANSAGAALLATRETKPDLVLMDVYMPEGDGVWLLKELRRRDEAVDVIAVTAAREALVVREMMRYGAVAYLVKPFKFERLESTLRAYRRWRTSLDVEVALTQPEIDRLSRLLSVVYQEELPKGLDQLTLRGVTGLLQGRREFLTAEEVAEQVGASRVTARRYLEYLSEVGQAEVKLSYGTVGRPVRRYRWVELGPGATSMDDGIIEEEE